MEIEMREIGALIPYVRNARTHSADQVAQIAASIAEFGFTNPILVDGEGVIIAGHGRLMAAKSLDLGEVPVIVLDHLTEAQRRALVLADNRIAENAGWDQSMLSAELAALRDDDFDLDLIGFDDEELQRILDEADLDGIGGYDGDEGEEPGEGGGDAEPDAPRTKLADRFGVPPFSVLDARKGWWQDRKRAWIAEGLRSELGRGGDMLGLANAEKISGFKRGNAAPGGSAMPAMNYSKSKARGDGRGRPI